MTLSPAFIICSASSGSTLLANLLDRHIDIACGPELYAFNKNQIYCSYQDFQKNLPKWLTKGMMCDGQISSPSFFLNKDAYYCDNDKLIYFSKKATDLRSFFDLFFDNYLTIRNKKMWIEKSGSNSYYLNQILSLYPNAKLIHITRDGRDSVTSIIKRNGSPYHAISHWLYNVSASLNWRGYANYLEIKYEDLVTNPAEIVNSVFQYLGFMDVDVDKIISDKNNYWQEISQVNIHSSWLNNPAKEINSGSIGRFKQDMSPEIQNLFWRAQLTCIGKRRLNTKYTNTLELMKALNYIDDSKIDNIEKIKIENYKDALLTYFLKAKQYWTYEKKIWLPITQM